VRAVVVTTESVRSGFLEVRPANGSPEMRRPSFRPGGPRMRHALSDDATPEAALSVKAAFGHWYLHSRSGHRDPTVIDAYSQLQAETDHLYKVLTRDDYPWAARVVFTRCRQPYESDKELIRAVRDSGTLEITTAAAVGKRLHPLLGCEFGGAFDRFRAVHDLIGHAWCGYGFDLADECAAWSAQDRLHSGLARCALAAEIFGVNAARSIVGGPPDLRALLLAPSVLRCSVRPEHGSKTHSVLPWYPRLRSVVV
jgi:hypothetical protein